jgi:hypothetical protein
MVVLTVCSSTTTGRCLLLFPHRDDAVLLLELLVNAVAIQHVLGCRQPLRRRAIAQRLL